MADRRTRARRDRLPRVKEEVGRGFRVLRLEAYARSTVPASVLYWVEQVAERERGRRGPLSLVVPGREDPYAIVSWITISPELIGGPTRGTGQAPSGGGRLVENW